MHMFFNSIKFAMFYSALSLIVDYRELFLYIKAGMIEKDSEQIK